MAADQGYFVCMMAECAGMAGKRDAEAEFGRYRA
jgi:hypothetical protein